MTIREIRDLLDARCHTPDITQETWICCACAADLMSDVMAFMKEKAALLTGLVTPAAIRTSELLVIPLIVFVRGKNPGPDLVSQAEDAGICLLSTDHSLFEASGLLFRAGLEQSGIRKPEQSSKAGASEGGGCREQP